MCLQGHRHVALTVWVTDDASNPGRTASPDLAVKPLDQINAATKEFPPPSLITKAVRPERFASERRVWIGRVTDKTPDCVGVHAQEEWDKQVMGVPKGLKRLLADPVVSSCVHH